MLSIKRITQIFLLACVAFIVPAAGKPASGGNSKKFNQAQAEFDNGNYAKAINLARSGVKKARKNRFLVSKGLDVIAASEISLGKYDEAEKTLNESLELLSGNESNAHRKALIYTRFAWLYRSRRIFAAALEYSKKAVAAAPSNRRIEAEHYFNVGRILFTSGYDISAVVWLEKAEKLLEAGSNNPTKLDVYRFLSLAWSSKLNYPAALKYAQKWLTLAENTRFKYKYRQALFEWANILNVTGQSGRATVALQKGLKASLAENNSYDAGNFLTSLMLTSLIEDDVKAASDYLKTLEKVDENNSYTFEIALGKAIISAFQNQPEVSEKLFADLEKMKGNSKFILPNWKITIAKKHRDWERVIKINRELLELTENADFRDALPGIYLTFAEAYFRLGQTQESLENLEKSLAFIEDIRKSENPNLSLSLFEIYHDAYRLLSQIKADNPLEAFELADYLKARLLNDRIHNSPNGKGTVVSPGLQQKLEELSLKFIDDRSVADEIKRNERLVTVAIPELNLAKPDLAQLNEISDLDGSAVVSYFFTLDKKLMAFVWEKNKPLKTVHLTVSKAEVEDAAKTTERKIKDFIFFKRDGKKLYDELLKPLNLSAKHLIVIPDKALWKIPFQALSANGEKYLIEEKLISYAPSVSVLLKQIKYPKTSRQTLQAFANSAYENRVLQYVNAEAANVAEIYGSKPILNATALDLARNSDKADILHFSMHAQVDKEQPLDSYLGFRTVGKDDGRLTAEELLNVKLKKGSLAFLASCDTNNVLDGEGLVSLAWAMMGSGATTVISAQWEANDKSTEIFTKTFYKHYKQGNSSAESIQKASFELIKNKSSNMHEPYYWADFTLNGDYR